MNDTIQRNLLFILTNLDEFDVGANNADLVQQNLNHSDPEIQSAAKLAYVRRYAKLSEMPSFLVDPDLVVRRAAKHRSERLLNERKRAKKTN